MRRRAEIKFDLARRLAIAKAEEKAVQDSLNETRRRLNLESELEMAKVKRKLADSEEEDLDDADSKDGNSVDQIIMDISNRLEDLGVLKKEKANELSPEYRPNPYPSVHPGPTSRERVRTAGASGSTSQPVPAPRPRRDDPIDKFIVRQSHRKELPTFTWKPEDWPIFLATYTRSTETCGFNDEENLVKLQRCLRGEAEKAVKALLVSPDNLEEIMDTLKPRFGKVQHIVRTLIAQTMALPAVKPDKLETVLNLGTSVMNLTTTIPTLKADSHLANPQLLSELEEKLTPSMRMGWARWVKMDEGRQKDLIHFVKWIWIEADLSPICVPPVSMMNSDLKNGERKECIRHQKVRSVRILFPNA